MKIPRSVLRDMELHFHAIIRQRAGELIDQADLQLPELKPLVEAPEPKGWFPIPGMYGGFSYWLEGEGDQAKLIAESWTRIVEGSGQRHEVTAHGSKLVDQGFA